MEKKEVKPKKKMGRPLKEFDEKVFEGLCYVQATREEIESVLHADIDTVGAWCLRHYGETFSLAYKRFSNGGKSSLRRYQFNQAKKNCSMAIWLGKIWLGQKEVEEIEERMNKALGILEKVEKVLIVDGNSNSIENASQEPSRS